MVLNKGEKIHIITRRLFEGDLRRHFIGEVVEISDTVLRVEGYVFVYDSGASAYLRRNERRIRIVSIASAESIINVIPQDVQLEDLEYKFNREERLIVTDNKEFSLDINEFGARM